MAETGFPGDDRRAPWAREVTLQALLASSRSQSSILNAMAAQAGINAKVQKEQTQTQKDLTESNEDLTKATKDLSKSLSDNVDDLQGVLSGRQGFVQTLKYKFDALGAESSRLSGSTSKLWQVMSLMATIGGIAYDRVSELADGVFKAYDAGVAFTGGMNELNRASGALGLNLDKLTSLLVKNALVVSQLGTRRTIELGKALGQATRLGTDLGMTNEQVNESMLSYLETLRATNLLQNMSNSDIIKGTERYITELNAAAQATGKNREQIEAEIKQRTKAPDFLAVINRLAPDARAAFARASREQFSKLGSMADTVQTMVAQTLNRGSIAGIDAAKRLALTQSGADKRFYDYINALRQDNVEEADRAIADVFSMLQRYSESTGQGLAIGAGLASEIQQFAAQAGSEMAGLAERLNKAYTPVSRDAARQVQTRQELNKALMELNAEINALLLPVIKAITPVFRTLADVVHVTTEAFDSLLRLIGIRGDGPPGEGGSGALTTAITGTLVYLTGRGLLRRFMPGVSAAGGLAAPMLGALQTPGMTGLAGQAGAAAAATTAARSTGMLARLFGKAGPILAIGTMLDAISSGKQAADQSGSTGKGLAVGAGTAAGGLGGVAAGGVLGAAVGTAFVPVIGTIVGGVAGAVLGALGGEAGGSIAGGLYDMIAGTGDNAAATTSTDVQEAQETVRDYSQQRVQEHREMIETMQDQTRQLIDAIRRNGETIH